MWKICLLPGLLMVLAPAFVVTLYKRMACLETDNGLDKGDRGVAYKVGYLIRHQQGTSMTLSRVYDLKASLNLSKSAVAVAKVVNKVQTSQRVLPPPDAPLWLPICTTL